MASHGVDRRCLVTGGAGFIGCNLADALLRAGLEVCVLDDLSRPGVVRNLDWLRSRDDGGIDFLHRDVRDAEAVKRAVAGVDVVFHLAGQTAVTTSVLDPRGDFEANALGMLNVLEAARHSRREPIVLYASTNKVYGGLEQFEVVEEPTRYAFADLKHGIDERQPLAPHSPYACSKGAADQYALDYHRIYGVRTVVFRQSCIYGPRQLGSEEQGWVAWFLDAARDRRPVTVFGNGKQVRDLLYVDDLVEAYTLAIAAIGRTAGEAYNIGGGAERTLAIWAEFEPLLAEITERVPDVPRFQPARPGDQRVFFCDTRKAAADFGWRARVSVREGVAALAAWMEGRTDSSADPTAAG
ncbi:MAG: GDP-mannose 4,6-dehydratase [Actinobacteria bacterium]|nr:GDP-mannose 4,6-dehydratase [Actinomycetota bacterium]